MAWHGMQAVEARLVNVCERVGAAHGPRRMSICLSALSAGERVSECDICGAH